MNDDRYIRSINGPKQVGCEKATMTANVHPITKWLLRTILVSLYAKDDEQLVFQIGESEVTLSMLKYKLLQQNLIAIGYPKDEVCRGMFEEDTSSDNMCRCFNA